MNIPKIDPEFLKRRSEFLSLLKGKLEAKEINRLTAIKLLLEFENPVQEDTKQPDQKVVEKPKQKKQAVKKAKENK